MTTHPAVALWECWTCGAEGKVTGVVATQPNTPDGPGDAEFYPEKDSSGAFFAGCISCGSEDVGFDDVMPYSPIVAEAYSSLKLGQEEAQRRRNRRAVELEQAGYHVQLEQRLERIEKRDYFFAYVVYGVAWPEPTELEEAS